MKQFGEIADGQVDAEIRVVLEAGRAVQSGTGVRVGGRTPPSSRHWPAHETSIGINLHRDVLGAPQSPAHNATHPRRLLVLTRAPTTSRARPILIWGLGHAGRWPSSLHQLSRSHRIKSFFRITNLHFYDYSGGLGRVQQGCGCGYRAVLVLSQGHVSLPHRDA